jgi:prephenate dehydrogenase
MTNPLPFRRVAILGTGLIGGSFALALRKHFPEIVTVGYDRPDGLERARQRNVVQQTSTDLAVAIRGADLVYVALPIVATIEALPEIAAAAEPGALVTDAGSTKAAICKIANEHFDSRSSGGVQFVGGHPMAGKEHSGVEYADADLFRGAHYVLIGTEENASEPVKKFRDLLREIGAEPSWCDADTHDWAVGIVSHLPQLVAVALARVVQDETDETGLPVSLAGPGLQDTLRLAGSPYAVWRDILLTNRNNVSRALDRLAQAVDHLRSHLASKDLEQEFQSANELYKLLRKLP